MENDRINALKQALKMEKDGKTFYESALERAENELAKKIFSSLIKAEDRHIQKINIFISINIRIFMSINIYIFPPKKTAPFVIIYLILVSPHI